MSLEDLTPIIPRIEEKTVWGPYGQLQTVVHGPHGVDTGYVLVLCHGFRGSKEGGGRAVALAEKAAAMGFAVLRFDFTLQNSLSCQIREIEAIAEFCRAVYKKQVIVLGRSMGGAAALAFAANDQEIAGLCLWATPWNLHETFRMALGPGYETLAAGKDFAFSDEYGSLHLTPNFISDFANHDLLKCVASLVGIPLLVVHGDQDDVVPVAQAKDMFSAARQPKDIVIIPGGDHQFLSSHQVASGAVLNWLARMFADSGI